MGIRFKSTRKEGHREGILVHPGTHGRGERALRIALRAKADGALDQRRFLEALTWIVREMPEFVDGHRALGEELLEIGKAEEASAEFMHAMGLCEAVMPRDYSGQMRWAHPGNAPYLEAALGLARARSRLDSHRDAIGLMEWLLKRDPEDPQGVRFLIGSEYLRAGLDDQARMVFVAQGDDYPPYRYELALLEMMEEAWEYAVTMLRLGFCELGYLGEILTGTPYVEPLPVEHPHPGTEVRTAERYIRLYGKIWYQNPSYRRFARWLFNHSQVLTERARIQAGREAMRYAASEEERADLREQEMEFLESIDDARSAQIAAPRTDRFGRVSRPWEAQAGRAGEGVASETQPSDGDPEVNSSEAADSGEQ